MATTTKVRCNTATANGTELYYELRGDGPPIMFVSGGFGDAALGHHRWRAGEKLHRGGLLPPRQLAKPATGRLVHNVARRAGRRRRTAQVDLAPAAVYGNSLGADIGLNLVLRHP